MSFTFTYEVLHKKSFLSKMLFPLEVMINIFTYIEPFQSFNLRLSCKMFNGYYLRSQELNDYKYYIFNRCCTRNCPSMLNYLILHCYVKIDYSVISYVYSCLHYDIWRRLILNKKKYLFKDCYNDLINIKYIVHNYNRNIIKKNLKLLLDIVNVRGSTNVKDVFSYLFLDNKFRIPKDKRHCLFSLFYGQHIDLLTRLIMKNHFYDEVLINKCFPHLSKSNIKKILKEVNGQQEFKSFNDLVYKKYILEKNYAMIKYLLNRKYQYSIKFFCEIEIFEGLVKLKKHVIKRIAELTENGLGHFIHMFCRSETLETIKFISENCCIEPLCSQVIVEYCFMYNRLDVFEYLNKLNKISLEYCDFK
jgi:hypothetical protein